MITLSERGSFFKENYQLCVESVDRLTEDERLFIKEISIWNEEENRFEARRLCGIFREMNRLAVQKKGSLQNKQCYYCESVGVKYGKNGEILCQLDGVPDEVTAHITRFNSENYIRITVNNQKCYIFCDEKFIKIRESILEQEKVSDWDTECKKLLQKQAYNREITAKNLIEKKPVLYKTDELSKVDGSVYLNLKFEEIFTIIQENVQQERELLMIVNESKVNFWKDCFKNARVYTLKSLEKESGFLLEERFNFIWIYETEFEEDEKTAFLQFLLHTLDIRQSLLFFSNTDFMNDPEKMRRIESIFFMKDFQKKSEEKYRQLQKKKKQKNNRISSLKGKILSMRDYYKSKMRGE